MPILTPQDHEFFSENGYVVLRGAVPAGLCSAVIDATWLFLEMNPEDPTDWYRPPLNPGGMVEIYQHQALWDIRQHPTLHAAFSEILGTERLWVSFDRVCFKPPSHPDHPDYEHRGFIHWDVDTSRVPLPFQLQGVLYLEDTDENQGGFQCVPGMHRNLEAWIAAQPPNRNPKVPDLGGRKPEIIPGKRGDFLIWNSLLPHGNGHNRSTKPRWAQFITMYPAREQDEAAREYRIRCWQERLPPRGDPFPGDPRLVEQRTGKTAELTPLGRMLLGAEQWDSV